jgi:hypothetical protein
MRLKPGENCPGSLLPAEADLNRDCHMNVTCHEFFGCTKIECTMFHKGESRNCWDIEPTSTSCTNMLPKSVKMENKIFHCHNCGYYKHVHRTNNGFVKKLLALIGLLPGLRK